MNRRRLLWLVRTKTSNLQPFKEWHQVLKASIMAKSSWLWVLYQLLVRIIFWKRNATRCHWLISDLEKIGSRFLWITWLEKSWFKWSKVIWFSTSLIAYLKASVVIQIWYFKSKCLRIKALVKTFYICMKAFLAPKIRKSVSKFVFNKFDFLGLVNFDFLDLVKFTTIDRFLIFLLILSLSALLAALGTFWFSA